MTTKKRHLNDIDFVEALTANYSTIKINGTSYDYKENDSARQHAVDAFNEKLAQQNFIELANCINKIQHADSKSVHKLKQNAMLTKWIKEVEKTHSDEINRLNEAISEHILAIENAKFLNRVKKAINNMTQFAKAVLSMFTAFLIKIGKVAKENYHAVICMVANWIEKATIAFRGLVTNKAIIERLANELDTYISSFNIEAYLPDEVLLWVNKDMMKVLLILTDIFFKPKFQ